MQVVLGLDIGVASIGWALLTEDEATHEQQRILALGSRIFEPCVDDKTGVPTNQARRGKRLLRRQIFRRRQRREKLMGILQRAGLLPGDVGADDEGDAGAYNRLGDSYELRAKGLDHSLHPHQFGQHLGAPHDRHPGRTRSH